MRNLTWLFASALLFAPFFLKAGDDDLVVIVNKGNSVENLTKAQLRKIILGEQESWSGGKKVSVMLRAAGQPERGAVLRAICGMSEDEFNQHLMHSNFSGDTGGAPKALASAAAVRQLVMTLPGGIGFIRSSELNESVKAITVDGTEAGQPGYKLKVTR
jgi:phosphate transport system substrate-binding protein